MGCIAEMCLLDRPRRGRTGHAIRVRGPQAFRREAWGLSHSDTIRWRSRHRIEARLFPNFIYQQFRSYIEADIKQLIPSARSLSAHSRKRGFRMDRSVSQSTL